jgi:hypothetical protein
LYNVKRALDMDLKKKVFDDILVINPLAGIRKKNAIK